MNSDYIHIDEYKVYDFTKSYIEKRITGVKETFKNKILGNPRYSKEYKEHVSNPDNIVVNYRTKELLDIDVDLSYLEVKVTYDYTYEYVSDRGLR